MHILLVEDDALLADGLVRSLRQAGYVVALASNGKSADRWLENGSFDLAILDLGLPDLDGSAVLQRLRERRQETPVLVMSARMALEERVRLLNLGADDYVVKPVALAELEARVRALIRRGRGDPDPNLILSRLRRDTLGKRAWVRDAGGEHNFDLTAREWAAIEFLAQRVNRVISKEQMIQALYGWEEDITPNAIEKFISRLRSKLETAGV